MSVNLYSTYPEEIKLLNQPLGDFRIKACKLGEDYSTTVIADKDENVSGGSLEGEAQRWTILTTKASEIARWLAEEFGVRGVFVSLGDVPSAAEVAIARKRMMEFFKNEFDLASDHWEKTHTRRAINDIARLAAKVLGQAPEWVSADAISATKDKCPNCRKLIDKEAITCGDCGFVRNPAALAALQASVAAPMPPPVPAQGRQVPAR